MTTEQTTAQTTADRLDASHAAAERIRADRFTAARADRETCEAARRAARAFLLDYGIREATDGQCAGSLFHTWNRWGAYALALGIEQAGPGLHQSARTAGSYLGGVIGFRHA